MLYDLSHHVALIATSHVSLITGFLLPPVQLYDALAIVRVVDHLILEVEGLESTW